MNSIFGRPRTATDEQIKIILDWHRSRRTVKDWAHALKVTHNTINAALRDWSTPETWNMPGVRVVRGRKRALTVSDVQQLLEWRKTRKTRRDLARELGVSTSVIGEVIRRKGHYKRGCRHQQGERIRTRIASALGPSKPVPVRRTTAWAVQLRRENAHRMRRAWELGMI